VADIMTPAVLSVRPTALAGEVVRIMNSYRVHHVFVADETGTLIGVIGTSDLVRKLG
jgi:CBS domain-containing protein